jgi:secreted trypsin-like serine protease
MLRHGLVALLLIFVVTLVHTESLASRIAGGVKATLGDFPHTAAIRNRNSQIVYCSGSIIHKRYILIAAHW